MLYLHLPNGTLARRNLSLSLASKSLVQVGVNESGEADPLDDIEYSLRSNSVGVIVRKLDLSHLCFSLNFYFLMFLRNFPLCFPY